MIRFFKRNRPKPEPVKVDLPELLILRWWGYTPEEWDTLPAIVKVDKREGYFQAQGLAS